MSRNAVYVCEKLQRAGFEAYIVGGAVRDALLGVIPKDFDVATNATPEEVRHEFRRAFIIGRRFKLVHVMFGDETIEVSTFRSNRGGEVEADATGRITSDNVYGTQAEDAARRDFTINALYYDPTKDVVVDFMGGLKDVIFGRLTWLALINLVVAATITVLAAQAGLRYLVPLIPDSEGWFGYITMAGSFMATIVVVVLAIALSPAISMIVGGALFDIAAERVEKKIGTPNAKPVPI